MAAMRDECICVYAQNRRRGAHEQRTRENGREQPWAPATAGQGAGGCHAARNRDGWKRGSIKGRGRGAHSVAAGRMYKMVAVR